MDPSDTKYVGVHLGSFPGPMGHFLHKLDGSFSPSRPSYLYHGRYQGGNRLEMKKLNGHLGVWYWFSLSLDLVFSFTSVDGGVHEGRRYPLITKA